jgi:hypothetical protein
MSQSLPLEFSLHLGVKEKEKVLGGSCKKREIRPRCEVYHFSYIPSARTQSPDSA